MASLGMPNPANWGESISSPFAACPRISWFVLKFSCITATVKRIPAMAKERRMRVMSPAEIPSGIFEERRCWRGARTMATAIPRGMVSNPLPEARRAGLRLR